MHRNIVSYISAVLLGSMLLVGCGVSVDEKQTRIQEVAQKNMQATVGMPSITNWTEKKMLKDILELRDAPNLITYVYTQNTLGKMVYMGQAVGFGIPYSTEYTSPSKRDGNLALPQNDPNGLFSSQNTSATWIQYIDGKTGKREVMYSEPNMIIRRTPFPARLCESWSLPDDYDTLK